MSWTYLKTLFLKRFVPGAVGDSFGPIFDVIETDSDDIGISMEFALGVAEELEETNGEGGNAVKSGATASGVVLLRRTRKRINRMTATINLKRS